MTARNRRRTRTLTRTHTQSKPVKKKKPPRQRPSIQINWGRAAFQSLIGLVLLVDLVLLFFVVKRCTEPRITTEKPVVQQEEPNRILQIEVLNGCGVNGLAARFTDFLRQAGFDVIKTDNYESHNVDKTLIIDRRGNVKNALKIADALGLDRQRVLQEINAAYQIDATVILGRDFRTLGAWKNMENQGG